MTLAARLAASPPYNATMADPLAWTLADLRGPESDEVTRTLRDQPADRWLSDAGDGMLLHAVLLVALLGCVGAALHELACSHDRLAFFAGDLGVLLVLGLLALALVLRRIRDLRGRFGWMVTSFGFLQLRGDRLRLVRWPDVVEVEHRIRGAGRNRLVTISVTTASGALECHYGGLLPAIRERTPATARFVQDT